MVELSSVRENGVIVIAGRKAIVVNRFPEDRSSGGTEVQYENGERQTFLWDYENPYVKYLGKGRLQSTIELIEEKSDVEARGD